MPEYYFCVNLSFLVVERSNAPPCPQWSSNKRSANLQAWKIFPASR